MKPRIRPKVHRSYSLISCGCPALLKCGLGCLDVANTGSVNIGERGLQIVCPARVTPTTAEAASSWWHVLREDLAGVR